MGLGDGGWGLGVWGLGIGPNPQSPIPNPQSPSPPYFKLVNVSYIKFNFYFLLNIIYMYD